MQALIIKDLAVTADLDRSAMSAVRGGTGRPYSAPSYWGGPSFDVMKNDFNFSAAQSLDQSQNTLVNNGNNVAFSSGITSNVNPTQTGSNNIHFG